MDLLVSPGGPRTVLEAMTLVRLLRDKFSAQRTIALAFNSRRRIEAVGGTQ